MPKMHSARFSTFSGFYPYYLAEHKNLTCRRLHFIGFLLILIIIAVAIFLENYSLLGLVPIAGYGFAWVGHFFFEHNKPATFSYPFYNLLRDWVMFKDILLGKLPR
jgi:hypothetical protein